MPPVLSADEGTTDEGGIVELFVDALRAAGWPLLFAVAALAVTAAGLLVLLLLALRAVRGPLDEYEDGDGHPP